MVVFMNKLDGSIPINPQANHPIEVNAKFPDVKKIEVGSGNYQFDEQAKVKSGADGDVYFAERVSADTRDPKAIAVKKAKGSGIQEQTNEVKVHQVVGGNEGIIQCLGLDASDHLLYLEKGEGALNNEKVIADKSFKTRKKMAKEVGVGVKYLHDHNITHNDINTKNMISFGENAKLTDFGNSTIFGDKNSILKIPSDMEWMLTDPDLRRQVEQQCNLVKSERQKEDRKDYIKAVYNILVGETEDKVIPDNFQENLQKHKGELKKYNQVVKLFSDWKKGEVPDKIEDITRLL